MNAMLIVAVLALGQTQQTPAAPPPVVPQEAEMANLLQPFFVRQAAAYSFLLGSQADRPLQLIREPVMAWKGDGSWFGNVFVWMHQGRPEMIGCIGSWKVNDLQRGVFHEFHSLATEPVSEVRIGTKYTWSRTQPGVELREIEGAPSPAATRRLRLLQMRRLARDFSVSLKSEMDLHVLRMQTPLVRYGEECPQDGALFPFVWTVGTDPEAFLVLETRQTQNGPRWFYGPARFTWRPIWLYHKENEVWHTDQYNEQYQTKKLTGPYATIPVENVTVAELQELAKRQTAAAR